MLVTIAVTLVTWNKRKLLWFVKFLPLLTKFSLIAWAVSTMEGNIVNDAETKLGNHPSRFEIAQGPVLGKDAEELKNKLPELGVEDFTDPNHPLYGEVDEFGRQIPGWLDQITVRQVSSIKHWRNLQRQVDRSCKSFSDTASTVTRHASAHARAFE